MRIWRRVLGAAVLLAAALSIVPGVLRARDASDVPSLVCQGVTFLAGVLLLRVPELRRDGWWVLGATIGVGVAGFDSSVYETGWGSGYLIQVGWSFYYAEAACLVGPILRLPDQPASPRTVRWLSAGFWVVLVGLVAVSSLFWDPVSMKGYTGPGRWFTLYPFYPPGWGLPRVLHFAFIPIAVGFTLAQLRRHRRAAGPNRTALRLLAWLSVLLVWGIVGSFFVPDDIFWYFTNVHTAALAATVVVVLVVAISANLRRAGFLDALLAAGGDAATIEAVLARYLADPTLRLRFRTEEGWTDAVGQPVAEAAPAQGRVFRPIVVEPDGPAVVADLDAGLDPGSRSVGPLLDAAGVVLARGRLSVQQAARAIELRASRARIVEAGARQRRQLERDLHDGAQQHLLAAQAALARAGLGGEPEAVSEAIAFAQSRLTITMAELRGLARGLHPALLSQAGLASALGSLVQLSDRIQVQLTPALVGRRFAAVVEATAWFVASEGVVNALKHTDATVTVTADVADSLQVTIADAGGGGADFTPGGGLAGLRDRVRGAGGTLHLNSPVGGGTTLTVTLPARAPQDEP